MRETNYCEDIRNAGFKLMHISTADYLFHFVTGGEKSPSVYRMTQAGRKNSPINTFAMAVDREEEVWMESRDSAC